MTVGKVQPKAPSTDKSPQQSTVNKGVGASKIPPAPKGNGAASGVKSFSLKNLANKVQQPASDQQNKAEKVKVEEPIDPSWNESFDQEKLDEIWRRFTRQYESSPRIHTIYKNHRPKHVSGVSLLIKLRNNTQQHELTKERPTIVSYLRRELKNAKLELNFEIDVTSDDGPKRAFTVADKFKAMSEKNPLLAVFKKEFNLDIE